MLSMVVAAMFTNASRVKNAWWLVMMTVGNVSSQRKYVIRDDRAKRRPIPRYKSQRLPLVLSLLIRLCRAKQLFSGNQ